MVIENFVISGSWVNNGKPEVFVHDIFFSSKEQAEEKAEEWRKANTSANYQVHRMAMYKDGTPCNMFVEGLKVK